MVVCMFLYFFHRKLIVKWHSFSELNSLLERKGYEYDSRINYYWLTCEYLL